MFPRAKCAAVGAIAPSPELLRARELREIDRLEESAANQMGTLWTEQRIQDVRETAALRLLKELESSRSLREFNLAKKWEQPPSIANQGQIGALKDLERYCNQLRTLRQSQLTKLTAWHASMNKFQIEESAKEDASGGKRDVVVLVQAENLNTYDNLRFILSETHKLDYPCLHTLAEFVRGEGELALRCEEEDLEKRLVLLKKNLY